MQAIFHCIQLVVSRYTVGTAIGKVVMSEQKSENGSDKSRPDETAIGSSRKPWERPTMSRLPAEHAELNVALGVDLTKHS